MLILGGRYGSIDPISGISYTELEYDYAAQQDKPLFAVVISNEELERRTKSIGSSVRENKEPKALDLFKEKVLSNVSSFFDDEKDIKLCVHESLADIMDNHNVAGWVSAAEIEDTKPLHAEIARLNDEIERLTSASAKSPRNPISADKTQTYEAMKSILMDTIVKLPENIAKLADMEEVDLFSFFVNNKDRFITGVTNSSLGNQEEKFCYLNVSPKLMVHGLMENEKVAGAQYRRSYVTRKGLEFLQEYEKRAIARKNKEKEKDAAP